MTPGWTIAGVRVRFSLLFPAMLTLLCSMQSGRLTAWCLLAAVMHECGHLVALCCIRNKPREIHFSAFGMCLLLNDMPMRTRQQIAVALGGPAVNLVTAGVLYAFAGGSDLCGIHLLLGLINLLPIWPLDGGQCLPQGKISTVVSVCFLCAISGLGILLAIWGNVSLAAVCAYLWFRTLTRP
ncbi:MAG: hypothetical protein IJC17_04475 [Clostridia bacterium]|nr:hypothetical protein [Clostridia bacterium]